MTKKKEFPRKRGRKTLYRDSMMKEGQKLAELGFTNDEIADFWGCSRRAFQYWLKRYPEFMHSLKVAKEKADKEVEKSLYKRALGFQYKEKTYEKRGDKMKLVKEVEKHVIPDTTAQIFWSKNRNPKKWRERHEMAVGGAEDLPPIKYVPVDGGPQKKKAEAEK